MKRAGKFTTPQSRPQITIIMAVQDCKSWPQVIAEVLPKRKVKKGDEEEPAKEINSSIGEEEQIQGNAATEA